MTDMLNALPAELLKHRLDIIKAQIKKRAEISGRDSSAITLVAVTKTVPSSRVKEALELGICDIGENRIQEAEEKFSDPLLASHKMTKHLIGHLQTNKAKKAVSLFSMVQSIDSLRVAEALNRYCEEMGRRLKVLIEVKLGTEDSKFGLSPEFIENVFPSFLSLRNLDVMGLMTILPLGLTKDEQRLCFRRVRGLFDEMKSKGWFVEPAVLSMGMTDDYEVAIEEGSTMVRIGRGLFGDRIKI